MENSLVRLKLKQRLNKLASSDFVNLECWQEIEVLNKAQLQILRRTIRDGDESTKLIVDDFNILLEEKFLKTANRQSYFETEVLPEEYLYFKKLVVKGYRNDCDIIKNITCTPVEEANVDFLLVDYLKKPSFKWGETFITFFGNKVRVWTGGDFLVRDCIVSYYRKPKYIAFADCRDYDDQSKAEQRIEFRNDITEIIIDEAAKIASADINDYNNSQRSMQEVQMNK